MSGFVGKLPNGAKQMNEDRRWSLADCRMMLKARPVIPSKVGKCAQRRAVLHHRTSLRCGSSRSSRIAKDLASPFMTKMAVKGSLIPGDRARSAISTSSRTAYSMSSLEVRSSPDDH